MMKMTSIATFTSAASKAKSGTFTFAVTGVTLSGYAYDSAKNVETTLGGGEKAPRSPRRAARADGARLGLREGEALRA